MLFLVKLLAWAMTNFGTVLKGNTLTGIFNHICVLEQNFIFVGLISIAISHTLLTYFTILHCTTLYYTIILAISSPKVWSVSAINTYDKSRRLLWIYCCWFCIYFKRLLLKPSHDCSCNVKKIFLTTIMYLTTRDSFTAAKNLHRIGLKRYLINRSSRVLLIFLFWFAKMPWSGRK